MSGYKSHIAGKLRAKISNVIVEVDAPNGTRRRVEFLFEAEAKRYYRKALKDGRNPRVVAAEVK